MKATRAPNIVFLFPDQLRADFLGCYGASFMGTPNIDRLAGRGVRYLQAYSTHPLCVPARVSLLTGMDALKTGVLDNGQFLRPDYSLLGIRTWPELLAEAGYRTAAVGKMHFYPWDIRLGFHDRSVAEDKRWIRIQDDYTRFLKANGYRKYHAREDEGYLENRGAVVSRIPWSFSVDHCVGQEACRFIREHREDRPFALMVGFPGPHDPYDPSAEYVNRFEPAGMPDSVPSAPRATPGLRQACIRDNLLPWNGVDYTRFTAQQKRKVRAHYAALVAQIDFEVGEILGALAERGFLKDTAVVFASDHGDYLGDHDLIGKGSFYESATRVPLIVSTPARVQPDTCAELVALTDVTATVLSLGGCAIPAYQDSTPLPETGFARRPRAELFGALSGGWMVYDGTWKLARYRGGETVLFNLERDPQEQRNLAESSGARGVYRRLDRLLAGHLMDSHLSSHEFNRVYAEDLSQDPAFGAPGWQRPYPHRFAASASGGGRGRHEDG